MIEIENWIAIPRIHNLSLFLFFDFEWFENRGKLKFKLNLLGIDKLWSNVCRDLKSGGERKFVVFFFGKKKGRKKGRKSRDFVQWGAKKYYK